MIAQQHIVLSDIVIFVGGLKLFLSFFLFLGKKPAQDGVDVAKRRFFR